jgi:single-strand DNA-binding protein
MRILENQVHLVGNLAAAPVITTLSDGNKLARFAIATKAYSKSDSGKVESVKQWHRIVAKGRFASIMEEFAEKGARIAVEGKLCSRFFRTKDGQNRYSTEIEVDDVVFLGNLDVARSA